MCRILPVWGGGMVIAYSSSSFYHWNLLLRVIWFGFVLWHINHCRLFNAKSSLYIYIKYIWFGLVLFYVTSTIVGYLCKIHFYTYKQFYLKQFIISLVQFQIKNSSISNNPVYHKYSVSKSKIFYFKQFSIAELCSLNVKTLPSQIIQFNISTQFISISPK